MGAGIAGSGLEAIDAVLVIDDDGGMFAVDGRLDSSEAPTRSACSGPLDRGWLAGLHDDCTWMYIHLHSEFQY